MKTIALAQRLLRDLKEKDLAGLSADARLELVDAINGGLQVLHSHAPPHAKIIKAAIVLNAPTTLQVNVTKGSTELTGFTPDPEDTYCTIRIDGDAADNQIDTDGSLFLPYSGETGTANATIYHDATMLPEPTEEIIDDPENVDTGELLIQDQMQSFRGSSTCRLRKMRVGQPVRWWTEGNAANQASPVPSVFRVDTLPDSLVRLSLQISMGPQRVTFADILNGDAVIPLRSEQIESYLLPIARGILSSSSLWRNPEERSSAEKKAERAEASYAVLRPSTIATPSNRVHTPANF